MYTTMAGQRWRGGNLLSLVTISYGVSACMLALYPPFSLLTMPSFVNPVKPLGSRGTWRWIPYLLPFIFLYVPYFFFFVLHHSSHFTSHRSRPQSYLLPSIIILTILQQTLCYNVNINLYVICVRMHNEMKITKTAAQISLFLLELYHTPVMLSALGFFTIGRSTLTSVSIEGLHSK